MFGQCRATMAAAVSKTILALAWTLAAPLAVHAQPPPTNDECSSAQVIFPGAVPGTTIGATSDGNPNSCGASAGSPDVWYLIVADQTGALTADTCGAAFDTVLSVWDGCGGIELACNDDSCGSGSRTSVAVVAGGQYLIRVAGFAGDSGDFVLTTTIGGGSAIGACCIDGVCHQLSQADCSAASGTFYGNDYPCFTTTCGIQRFGLMHQALGQATLGPASEGDLNISNIGSSGNDGVAVALGAARGWSCQMSVAELTTPAALRRIELRGHSAASPDALLVGVGIEAGGAPNWINLSFDGLGATSSPLLVTAFDREGRAIGSIEMSSGDPLPIFNGGSQPCPPGTIATIQLSVEYYWVDDPNYPDGGYTYKYVHVLGIHCVELQSDWIEGAASFGVSPVDPDPDAPGLSPLTAISRASGVASFSIRGESLKFADSSPFATAIGQARMIAADGSLRVDGIGSEAQDGESCVFSPALHVEAHLTGIDPLGAAPDGAALEMQFLGRANGQPDQPLGTARITDIGSAYALAADYAAVGCPTQTIELLLGGVAVASFSGQSSAAATIDTWPAVLGAMIVTGPDRACFSAAWSPAISITIDGNTYLADELRSTPDCFGGADAITALNLVGAGISELTLTAVTLTPLPPPPCPGDADASGRVDQDDLDLILFNFGTPQPAGANGDVDDDGDVDQDDLDLVLFYFGATC